MSPAKRTTKTNRPLTEAEQMTQDIIAYLEASGYKAWGQPNRGEYDPKTSKWHPHPNSRRGVPDILGFRLSDAKFLGVEVKAGTDRPRPEQTQFLNELQAAGGLAFIAYSFAGFVQSFQRRGLHIPQPTQHPTPNAIQQRTMATTANPAAAPAPPYPTELPGPIITTDEPAPYHVQTSRNQ